MLQEVATAYQDEEPSLLDDSRLTDVIAYIEQMFDGGHLAEQQIAKLQQLGLRALQWNRHDP